ncbi:bacterial regulatory protein, gntR family domain-containing protein [Ditylenchus destructor]|uniref:Bacterial regulatory protein, gntR family domain-containing protein n=1 Tax=Ditylenchus destructor TaxID=166010 RepID=A0AAD4QR34_9BILA|nr:bacterial regulatory protein, gntR family domain-containing protein [Ditylenchus destructor]
MYGYNTQYRGHQCKPNQAGQAELGPQNRLEGPVRPLRREDDVLRLAQDREEMPVLRSRLSFRLARRRPRLLLALLRRLSAHLFRGLVPGRVRPALLGPSVHDDPGDGRRLRARAAPAQGLARRLAISEQRAGGGHRQAWAKLHARRKPAIRRPMTDDWLPDLDPASGAKYTVIADALAAAIDRGTLPGGTRLPPQRDLAARLGVDLTTVTRAMTPPAAAA